MARPCSAAAGAKRAMGKDKGARRERKSEGGGGASLKMVVGTCVWPACVVRAAAEQSARDGKEMRALKGTHVMVECTNRECTMGGKMHIECYEKLEHSLLGQKGLCGGAKSAMPNVDLARPGAMR